MSYVCFFFQAEDGIRDRDVTGVQTCALPIFEGQPRREDPRDDVGPDVGAERREEHRRRARMDREIGRASCRERVWNEVGGETVKKKRWTSIGNISMGINKGRIRS